MRVRDFLLSSWPVAFPLLALVFVCFILGVAGVGSELIVFAALVMVIGAAAMLVVEFRRRRSFLESLSDCAESKVGLRWIAEMVDRPGFLEGQLAFDAIRVVAKAANDDVAEYRRQVEDYREYVETWVHEAKSPLAAAHLMLDNLSRAGDAGDAAEIMVRTEALGRELDRVEGYIEQALFFARSESLDRDYLIRSYRLDDLVAAAIKANAGMLIGAHVAPVCTGLAYTVFTDEKWIQFILGQLIQNTVKYARQEGAEIRFSAQMLDCGLADERIELAVSDNGCGVSAADLPRVFERGFTGALGRSTKRSTGIGLYLVKRLCDKMGLSVHAESVEGEGFTVRIAFPTNKMHFFE